MKVSITMNKVFVFLLFLSVVLKAQALEPTIEKIDPFLQTPAKDHIYEIPLMIISYLPTTDGKTLNKDICGSDMSIDDMRSKIDSMNIRAKFMLEEGSKFRGYKNKDAVPSIGYRTIYYVTVYEEMPSGYEVPWNEGWYRPDYNRILERFNAEYYVDSLGVKEIWLWGYHHGHIEPAESNMSSPLTGDVSNSELNPDDLPVYKNSYVLYNYNFNRSQAEAVHNHGHHIEAEMTYVNKEQDGNSDLFWKLFVGRVGDDEFTTGRCGWTHMPPNTNKHYEYLNPAMVLSDIEDWKPDGSGEKKEVGLSTWENLEYDWPFGEVHFSQKAESQFYIYWFQSLPGYNNNIPYNETTLTNWWSYIGDWDKANTEKIGLYK